MTYLISDTRDGEYHYKSLDPYWPSANEDGGTKPLFGENRAKSLLSLVNKILTELKHMEKLKN